MLAQAQAADYGLGTPLAELGPARKYRVANGLAHGFLALFGLGLAIGGLVLVAGEARGRPLGAIFLPFGLILLAWGAWGLTALARDASWRVILCSGGFAQIRRGRTDLFRWEEIEAIYQRVTRRYVNGIDTGTTHIYTIRRADGLEVKLTDALERVEQLAERIGQGTNPGLLRRAVAAYEAGETVAFGKLTVGPQGLGNGRETLPWGAVGGARLERGFITINKGGRWQLWRATVAETPNVDVFLALVNGIIGREPAAGR